MIRRLLALFAAMSLLLPAAALAEAWEGVTVADQLIKVEAPASGLLEKLTLRVGQTLEEGQTLGSIRANRVYAAQNGSIARIPDRLDGQITGTVLELAPVSPYLVYASTDQEYEKREDKLIHAGETLYLRCTGNGTHRAIGFVHHVSDNTFQLELIAGEMYVGETAHLFRSADLETASRVGIGTIVSSPVETYTVTNGYVMKLAVKEGDQVERGQLLYTWSDGETQTVTAPASGLLVSIAAAQGKTMQKDEAVAEMVAWEDILLEIKVSTRDLRHVTMGGKVTYTRGVDLSETPCTGTITYVSAMPEDDTYTVRIKPDVPETMLGMTVDVRLDD